MKSFYYCFGLKVANLGDAYDQVEANLLKVGNLGVITVNQ